LRSRPRIFRCSSYLMQRFFLYLTLGQSLGARMGQGSHFIPMQKLCNRRMKTLVLTVRALATVSICSAVVSKSTRSRIDSSALSLAKVVHRTRFSLSGGLLCIIDGSAIRHVRVDISGSEAAVKIRA